MIVHTLSVERLFMSGKTALTKCIFHELNFCMSAEEYKGTDTQLKNFKESGLRSL